MKKGWNICVVSWENDADNYKTHVRTVATEEDAIFALKFIDLLIKNDDLLGTFEFDKEAWGLLIKELLEFDERRTLDLFETDRESLSNISELFDDFVIWEAFHKYVHYASEGFDFPYMRVVESVEVFYLAEDPVDITSQLRNK